MAFTIHKARREQAKILVGLTGASGSGKTHSALVIGQGMVQTIKDHAGSDYCGKGLCLIDTEKLRASLYADKELEGSLAALSFDTIEFDPPYTPERYIEAIALAESSGYDVIIIDSISHEWNSTGGVLSIVNQLSQVKGSSSFNVWAKVTPRHNAFMEALTSKKAHTIITMRTKSHWVIEKDEQTGKHKPHKVGTEPQQREGLEYEMIILLELDQDHHASIGNDRTTSLGDGFRPTADTGREIIKWQLSGADHEEIKALQKQLRQAAESAGGWKGLCEMVKASKQTLPTGGPQLWSLEELQEAVDIVNRIDSGEK